MRLRESVPFYVMRDGGIWSAPLWRALLVLHLVWLNIVLWGIVGIYTAIRVLV